MNEIWQTISMLESPAGIRKFGLCSQSILWSDASVFSSHSEAGGNALMYAMTEYSLNRIKGMYYENPIQLLDDILPDVYDYGKTITKNANLRKTFALNSLVGPDNAAWLLYADQNRITSFDEMIPGPYRPALSFHHNEVAGIPLISYNLPVSDIIRLAGEGYFFMKIKIGQPGSQKEMLEKDKQRLTEIHQAIGNSRTDHTRNGKIPYYLDANGRYEDKETLMQFLSHAEKIHAYDQVVLIEEPFPEESEIDVSGFGVTIAADESAHTDEDVIKRAQMGYKAIALKAIAKTLSMTLKMARAALENHISCFCADLTVNPILVDWNKNVAARLTPFPGFDIGLLETNGSQNYKNWETMSSYHPYPEASWRKIKKGVFNLDKDFYEKSGGIFAESPHYSGLYKK